MHRVGRDCGKLRSWLFETGVNGGDALSISDALSLTVDHSFGELMHLQATLQSVN